MDKYLCDNTTVKIIGDSLAAGAGSSQSIKTDRLIFEDEIKQYYGYVAPNSWWGLLETYLNENYMGVKVINNGCGGAFSYQINEQLDKLISDDDDVIVIMIGLNDRKREDGMTELKYNCESIVDRIIAKGIKLVDNYKYIMEYLDKNELEIDDIIYGEGCKNDGLHPSDFVQKLMFDNFIEYIFKFNEIL